MGRLRRSTPPFTTLTRAAHSTQQLAILWKHQLIGAPGECTHLLMEYFLAAPLFSVTSIFISATPGVLAAADSQIGANCWQ